MAAIEKLTGNFTEADIDDEIIIMRLDNGELLSLSGTAAVTWRLIDGRRNRAALIDELMADYDAGHEQVEQDVGQLLQQFTEARLVAEA